MQLAHEKRSSAPSPNDGRTRLVSLRLGRIQRLLKLSGFVRPMDGQHVSVHVISMLKGERLVEGDVVQFVDDIPYPHPRGHLLVQISPNDPLAFVIRSLDERRVRPVERLDLASWCSTSAEDA